MIVRVDLGVRSYDIHIGSGTLGQAGRVLAAAGPGRRALLVADGQVANSHAPLLASSLHAAGITTRLVVVPPGERSKSLDMAARLYDACIDCGLDRRSWIVAVGGGVVGDLAGFVAATFLRGIPFVQVPTTLQAQLDASVGGKVAVDHPRGKNLIGAFHQPRLVWCDVGTLATLPRPELVAGMTEAIKHGLIADPAYYRFVRRRREALLALEPRSMARLVAVSCRIKAAVVAADEREESGARATLNLGHTLGHALEAVAGYGTLRHGEAVAIGLAAVGRLARLRGLWSQRWQTELEAVLTEYGLPTRIPGLPLGELLSVMRLDKKAEAGQLRWVLPQRPGSVVLAADVPPADVQAVLLALGAVA